MKNDTPEMEEFESRWPRDGDRLFVPSEWSRDAYVVRDPGERFYRMPMGYKRAGDILIERAATDAVDRANVIYAALFCYRQSIELFLKKLVDTFDDEQARAAKTTHDLSILWGRFMVIARQRGSEREIGLGSAQALVAEMHQAEQKSDGFRFPTTTTSLPFAFGDRGIDLANVCEVMQGLANFFECAYLEFSNQDDVASEMARLSKR
jgi:hypothetical protein